MAGESAIAYAQNESVICVASAGRVTVWRAEEKLSTLAPLVMPRTSERLPEWLA
ncbi:MAG: hypothetical protein BWY52_01323 [Chloroflexi bacterium ADurb.Bin325]|nr:MAG: hypothetical protein BWY52_01323 [Chloroflexi bacterium ADurb.Bin325]